MSTYEKLQDQTCADGIDVMDYEFNSPNIKAYIVTALQQSIIPFEGMVIPFRFHDFRHYSASIMHAIGIPDQYIMARGGWKTDTVLKAVYRKCDSTMSKRNLQNKN